MIVYGLKTRVFVIIPMAYMVVYIVRIVCVNIPVFALLVQKISLRRRGGLVNAHLIKNGSVRFVIIVMQKKIRLKIVVEIVYLPTNFPVLHTMERVVTLSVCRIRAVWPGGVWKCNQEAVRVTLVMDMANV